MDAFDEMSARDVSVCQTLALLDSRFPDLVDEVGQGKYAFWLGSGISRDRLADVRALVGRILRYLQGAIDPNDSNCSYRRALTEALTLAMLSEAEQVHIDFARDIGEWETYDTIVDRLTRQYSELLDIRIDGQPPDFLLWSVVDVPRTYGDDAIEPDLEHLCLAVLIMEGVLPEVVSANWDGLIEKAVAELAGGSTSLLSVRVTSEDFRNALGRGRILKFHGCAVKAKLDEHHYRTYLVGRRSQITNWPNDADHSVMRQEMTNLAATRRTLMIGLSAQDENIQQLFSTARGTLAWQWPADRQAFVFAEDVIGIDQQNILRVAYGDSYDGNDAEIARTSLIRAFAKPLLAALVVATIAKKLAVFAQLSQYLGDDPSFRLGIEQGIRALRALAAADIDRAIGTSVPTLISEFGRAMSLFREGNLPPRPKTYSPLGSVPVNRISDDPTLLSGGIPQLALAIALLGSEHAAGTWVVSPDSDQDSRRLVLRVSAGGLSSRLVFASNPAAAVRLEMNGFADETDAEVVVVHSTGRPFVQQRSPSSAPGRTGQKAARHIDMIAIISESSTFGDLQQRFREEITV